MYSPAPYRRNFAWLSRLLALLLVLILVIPGMAADDALQESSPHLERLASYGLEPTTASIAGYLAALEPTPERQRAIEALVQQLDHPEFQTREEASRRLLAQVGGTSAALQKAIEGENTEIRWRAKQIFDETDRESRLLLSAVLLTVNEKKITGLCRQLLATMPYCGDDVLRRQLHDALVAASTPGDVPLLRRHVSSDDPVVRIAALGALGSLLGPEVDKIATALLSDPDERVQAAAARALANIGRRESLPALVRLLESTQTDVRSEAIRTLRTGTGQHFGFTAYDASEKRAAAIALWKNWLDENAATAPLSFPLKNGPNDLGRLLVCDHSLNLLIELDASGKELWKQTVGAQPWACLGLANGHRLVGSYNDRTVVEFDEQGAEVWRVANLPGGPMSIQRLDSGNTLIACTEGAQVVEVDPAKKIVWQAAVDGRPVDARRLDDGRTLIALQLGQKVVEVDRAGKQVWEIAGVGMVFSAQRLESGNTLVASHSHNKIREFDRTGRVVWERGPFLNPYSAQRLESGNTIVVDTNGITEIDSSGLVVDVVKRHHVSRAWRY